MIMQSILSNKQHQFIGIDFFIILNRYLILKNYLNKIILNSYLPKIRKCFVYFNEAFFFLANSTMSKMRGVFLGILRIHVYLYLWACNTFLKKINMVIAVIHVYYMYIYAARKIFRVFLVLLLQTANIVMSYSIKDISLSVVKSSYYWLNTSGIRLLDPSNMGIRLFVIDQTCVQV